MKIRLFDKLMAVLLTLIVLAMLAVIGAKAFFGMDLIEKANAILGPIKQDGTASVLLFVAEAAMLVLFGWWGLRLLFYRTHSKGFVSQKAEGGELEISINALKRMVDECLQQHSELSCESLGITQHRSAVTVNLRIALAAGISIPLTVNDLQKQIRTYVTACSGLEVAEVAVQVDHDLKGVTERPYVVDDMLRKALPEETSIPEEPKEERSAIFVPEEDEVNMPPRPEETETEAETEPAAEAEEPAEADDGPYAIYYDEYADEFAPASEEEAESEAQAENEIPTAGDMTEEAETIPCETAEEAPAADTETAETETEAETPAEEAEEEPAETETKENGENKA